MKKYIITDKNYLPSYQKQLDQHFNLLQLGLQS